MNKVALTPTKKPFGSTPVGGIFYVTKPQARIYIKLGLAKYADEPVAVPKPVVTKESEPVEPAEDEAQEEEKPKRKRRRYQRRDMRAED